MANTTKRRFTDEFKREGQIDAFVDHYNHRRYHESIDNGRQPTPTSAADLPSSTSAHASDETPSAIGACFTASSPPKTQPKTTPTLRRSQPSTVPNVLTTHKTIYLN